MGGITRTSNPDSYDIKAQFKGNEGTGIRNEGLDEYQLPLSNYAYSDGNHVVLSEGPLNLPGYSAMQKQP